MLVYNIQTINLYLSRTHIFIARTKKIAIMQNKTDAESDHTDVNTSYLST